MAIYTDGAHRGSINTISLCSGFGGLELGLQVAEPRIRTVCFIERQAAAAASLVARMEDKTLDAAPIWSDVKTFDAAAWRGKVHLLTGGYPCQPFSFAGRKQGENDPRHLWPDIAKIVKSLNPDAVLFENVKGHLTLGFSKVGRELQELGYTVKAGLFSAAETGASHVRERLFILGYTDRVKQWELDGFYGAGNQAKDSSKRPREGQANWPSSTDAQLQDNDRVSEGVGVVGETKEVRETGFYPPGPNQLQEWQSWLDRHPETEPSISRSSDGLADWLERSTGAGNGVCPVAAACAWSTLVGDALSSL